MSFSQFLALVVIKHQKPLILLMIMRLNLHPRTWPLVQAGNPLLNPLEVGVKKPILRWIK